MAKGLSDDEIMKFIKSKDVSSKDYKAPKTKITRVDLSRIKTDNVKNTKTDNSVKNKVLRRTLVNTKPDNSNKKVNQTIYNKNAVRTSQKPEPKSIGSIDIVRNQSELRKTQNELQRQREKKLNPEGKNAAVETVKQAKQAMRAVENVGEKEAKNLIDFSTNAYKYAKAIKNRDDKQEAEAVSNMANAFDRSLVGRGLKTAGNFATRTGYGALKGADWMLDWSMDKMTSKPLQYAEFAEKALNPDKKEEINKKYDTIQNYLDDYTKLNLAENIYEDLGWDEDAYRTWEKGSLVNRNNIGGQVAETMGEQFLPLLLGSEISSGLVGNEIGNKFAGTKLSKATAGLTGANKYLTGIKTAGENAAKYFIKSAPSLMPFWTTSYGGALEEALNEGATREQARRYATASAAVETGTEMMFDGIPAIKGSSSTADAIANGLIDKATGKITNKFAKQVVSYLARMGYVGAGEGAEEMVSEILNPALKNATYSNGEKIDWKQVLQSGMMGFISGEVMGAQNTFEESRNAVNNQINREAFQNSIQNTVNNAAQTTFQEITSQLDQLAQQRVQQIDQAVRQGQMTAQEGTKEIEDIQRYVDAQKNTLQQEQQPQQNQNNQLAQQAVQQINQQVQNGQISPQEGTQQIQDIQRYLQSQEAQTEQQQTPIVEQENAPTINETIQDNINAQEQQNMAQNRNNEVEEKTQQETKYRTSDKTREGKDVFNIVPPSKQGTKPRVESVEGTISKIKDMDVGTYYDADQELYITADLESGLKIASGKTENSSIKNAKKAIDEHPDMDFAKQREKMSILTGATKERLANKDYLDIDTNAPIEETLKEVKTLKELKRVDRRYSELAKTSEQQEIIDDAIYKKEQELKAKENQTSEGKRINDHTLKYKGYYIMSPNPNVGYNYESLEDANYYSVNGGIDSKGYGTDNHANWINSIDEAKQFIDDLTDAGIMKDRTIKQSEAFNLSQQEQTNVEQQPTQAQQSTQTQQPTQTQQELKNTKIVDEDGKPLNVFHRSNIKNIKQLEARNGAIFFAKDGNATYYGKEKYSANLNVTNPLVIDANGANFNQIKFNQDNVKQYNSSTIENAINNIDKLTKEDVVKIAQAIDKNNSINDYIDQFKDAKDMLNSVVEAYTDGGTIEDFIKQYGRLNAYIDNNNLQTNKVTTTRDIVEYAKEKGYDGVIFKNVQDKTNGKTDVYAVFNPEQVLNMKYETQQKNNTEQQMPPKENNNIPETKTEPVVKVDLTGEKGKEYFMENGADEKVAQILSEIPKEQKPKLIETLKNIKDDAYRLFVSNRAELERIAKVTNRPDIVFKHDKAQRYQAEANHHIAEEQTDLNYKPYKNFTNENGEKVNMSLDAIRKDAKNHNISEQTLNEYLAHNLNVDRYMEDKPVFGKSVTSDDSLKRIAEIEQEHPEIKRIAQNVWTYEHNELKNTYDSGRISKELYDKLSKYEHYVRIQRNVARKGSNAGVLGKDGKISIDEGIQEAKGGNQDILPIMETIAQRTIENTKANRINESVRESASAMSMGSEDSTISSIDDEESFGVNPDLFKQNEDGTYTMTFFNNGVATVVPINKAIYDAYVTNKYISAMENNRVFKFVTYLPKKVSSMFRTLTTNDNPMFMATNAFKDIGDAPFNSKYAKEFAEAYTSTQALREVAGNGGYNKLYSRAGGNSDSYFVDGEFKDKTQSKIGKAKDKLLTPTEKGNEVVESTPRMAEFIATIKANGYEVNSDGEMILKDSKKANGRSAESVLDEALYNAAEITTNFKRGGDLAKAINRNGGTFFNASIQGFDKQVRNFKDAFTSGDKKKIIALLTKALIFGVAPTMLNDAMNDDDDEYKNMQDYLKDNYYLFKGKNGNYIRIPKGRAMSVIGSAYRRTKDYASGNKDAFKGYGKFASTQVAPNNFFENNIIAPLFAVGENKSWSGNPIVSQTLEEGSPTEERYTEKTDKFSKWLGKQLKNAPIPERYKTPAGINYLIDQYTGGVGDVLLPTITPKATSKSSNPLIQPFISKFTTDSVYQQKDVNEFYDVKKKLKQQKGASYATKEDKVKYSYMDSRSKELSALYAQQHEIQNDKSLNKKEKYEQAREVQKKINKFADESVKNVNNIKDHTYYATIGDDIYYLTIDKKTGKDIWSKDSYADSHKKAADKKGMALYDYYKEKYEERKAKKK